MFPCTCKNRYSSSGDLHQWDQFIGMENCSQKDLTILKKFMLQSIKQLKILQKINKCLCKKFKR